MRYLRYLIPLAAFVVLDRVPDEGAVGMDPHHRAVAH